MNSKWLFVETLPKYQNSYVLDDTLGFYSDDIYYSSVPFILTLVLQFYIEPMGGAYTRWKIKIK